MKLDLSKMNPAFTTLVAAVSTRDQIPFDQAAIVVGNMLAEMSSKQEDAA